MTEPERRGSEPRRVSEVRRKSVFNGEGRRQSIFTPPKDDEPERHAWTGKLDFFLTCVGYAVGLGNIWRFPYLCYRSGGGAFFIPYVFFLVICGLPLFLLEVSVGQFASQSPIMAWNISPLFRGVGIGMVIISGIVCIYYNVIVAWTIYYLAMSFRGVLPWSHCNNTWNSEYCIDASTTFSNATNATTTSVMRNGHGAYNVVDLFDFRNASGLYNLTGDETRHKLVKASEEFWELHVLQITKGIDQMGTLRWELLLCLIFAWFLVFLILFKGVNILGKAMHIMAPLPYIVLLILLVKGCMLPGAYEGIKFYFLPRWEKLATFAVWGDAAVQIFYSVGPGWGGLVTMASFNQFNNNVYRDAMLVPIINCATSVFAGVVIFSVLGFMAQETGGTIESVVTEGPGLTFVVYPEAVTKLPISPLWAILFFIMLFTVGLDSQFAMFETMLSAFMDAYPKLLRKRKLIITACACAVSLILGIPCIMQGGIYVLQIIDWYSACFSIMIITITESLVIGWIYGADRFYDDIELMIGFRPCPWWKYSWKFITPLVTGVVWLSSMITMQPVTYGKDYTYPQWSVAVGWMIGAVSIIPLVAIIIFDIVRSEGSLLQRLKKLTRPNAAWGPLLPQNREAYELMVATKPYGAEYKLAHKQSLLKDTEMQAL